MADNTVVLNQPKKNQIQQPMDVTQASAQAQAPDVQIPPEIAAAIGSPSVPSLQVPKAPPPEQAASPDYPLPSGDGGTKVPLDLSKPPLPPPPPVLNAMDQSRLASIPSNVPPPGAIKTHKSILEHVADFLPLVGAIGGGLEAAGDPAHPPVGAEMLQRSLQNQRQLAFEREKMEKVDIPVALSHARYFDAAAPAKVEAANIGAQGRVEAAGINKRFQLTPAGLYDTQVGSLVPETGAGIAVTPEIAQQYKLPPQFIGKPMKLTDLAAAENAQSRNLTPVQGAKGPALVNKREGTAKDLGLGPPAAGGAAAQAQNAAVQVWRTGADGKPVLQTISRAEQLRTGEPSAQVQFAETGPTSATRNMSQMAQTIEPHLNTLRDEIKELSPYLGPLMGRGEVNFLAGTVGSTGNPTLDYKLGRLMSDFKLASSAVGRTHFAGRTGLPAAQYFAELFNAKRTPEELMGILDSVPSYIEGYGAMGNFSSQQPLLPSKGSSSTTVKTPPTVKTIPVMDSKGKQIGTATPDQQKRGTYTPLKQR